MSSFLLAQSWCVIFSILAREGDTSEGTQVNYKMLHLELSPSCKHDPLNQKTIKPE